MQTILKPARQEDAAAMSAAAVREVVTAIIADVRARGDVAMTITPSWQARFNASGIVPEPRMHLPVDPGILAELTARIPDFGRAYEPDGLTPAEFDTYGPTARTLRAFIASYHDLQATIRDIVLPNPDLRTS